MILSLKFRFLGLYRKNKLRRVSSEGSARVRDEQNCDNGATEMPAIKNCYQHIANST